MLKTLNFATYQNESSRDEYENGSCEEVQNIFDFMEEEDGDQLYEMFIIRC